MTVSTENCYAERAWTGVETSFTPGFSALAAADVLVYSRDALGVETLLTLNVHYGVTLDAANGAVTVTPIALPAAPKTLLILRTTPALQDTNFANLAKYAPTVHTRLHDAAAMRDAEDKFHRDRALLAPIGESITQLPRLADRASKFLAFDADSNPVAAAGVASVPVTAFAATLLDDLNADAMLTTLGAGAVGKTIFAAAAAMTVLAAIGLPGETVDNTVPRYDAAAESLQPSGVFIDDAHNIIAAGVFSPVVVGGTGVGSALTLRSTTGVGTSDAIIAQVGNAGATEAWRCNTSGVFIQAVGGANALDVPNQISPFTFKQAIGGTYADSSSGNIFQLSSWITNSGSRNTVGVMGSARGDGESSSVWGGNFIGYANAVGASAHGIEIDYGNLVAGGNALGLAVNVAGGNATSVGMQFTSLASGATMGTAIRFFYSSSVGQQPFTTALIDTAGGVQVVNGVDLSGATFSGSAFKSTGFSVDPSGVVTSTVAGNTARFINSTDSASVQVARFEGDRATMADNDEAYVSLMLSNDGGTQTEFGRLTWVATDVNAGTSVDGQLDFAVVTGGSLADELSLDGTALFPSSNDGLALGKTSTGGFSDLFLASGAVIDFNSGDVTINHSPNSLRFDGANAYIFQQHLDAGTVQFRLHNRGDGNVTTKLAAYQIAGTDTVGTMKEVIRLEGIPGDANWVNGSFAIYTRASDTVAEAARFGSDKSFLGKGSIKSDSATAGIGYATGAGGTVTQATSKATGVTLNKVVGKITMHNAALAAGAEVSFSLTNSTIVLGDAVYVHHSGLGTAGAYFAQCTAVSGGGCTITVTNLSGGSLSEAIELTFFVLKGVTA